MPNPGPITLEALQALKVADLQLLARLIGARVNGPKRVTAPHLLATLHAPPLEVPSGAGSAAAHHGRASSPATPPSSRILSLDMGVQNLAYCTLELPPAAPPPSSAPSAATISRATPIVRVWQRRALFSAPAAPATPAAPAAAPSRPFSLPRAARAAAALLRTLVISPADAPPAAVLLEAQRWRSGGGPAVAEWTLRVNTLEALLWGGLAVAQDVGAWRAAICGPGAGGSERAGEREDRGVGVHGVDPARVARWWLGPGSRPGPATSAAVKKLKIAVVADWLETGRQVRCADAAAETRERFLRRWKRQQGKRRAMPKEDGEEETAELKLDDLADCLLQGVAWLRWEENRRHIRERGLDAMWDIADAG